MLHHERVADGGHHGEDLLAGRVPPHQRQERVGLLLGVQLLNALRCDQLDWDPKVILREREGEGENQLNQMYFMAENRDPQSAD